MPCSKILEGICQKGFKALALWQELKRLSGPEPLLIFMTRIHYEKQQCICYKMEQAGFISCMMMMMMMMMMVLYPQIYIFFL